MYVYIIYVDSVLPNLCLPAAAVERRTTKNIRAHLQRRYNPSSQQGKWTGSEDATLIQYVFQLLLDSSGET